jgi:nucleotide sugar dehydrogenase
MTPDLPQSLADSGTDFSRRLKAREVQVGVIGMGMIGLVSATLAATSGVRVRGFDVNPARSEAIKAGALTFEYRQDLERVLKSGDLKLVASAQEAVENSDIVIICVSTSVDALGAPDTSAVVKASTEVGRHLRKGSIMVYESTLPLGTARKMMAMIESMRGFRVGVDFGLAVCPERYNQLDPAQPHIVRGCKDGCIGIAQIPRVFGCSDPSTSEIVRAYYSFLLVSPPRFLSSPEAAEATKIIENTFRMVNIAFANEASRILLANGLDPFEVIEAASKKPFGFLAHYPGPGVGGECIPVVSKYLVDAGKKVGAASDLVQAASIVNDEMPRVFIEELRQGLREAGKPLKGATIGLMGVAFRRNTDDVRLSPTMVFASLLEKEGARVLAHDPYVKKSSLRQGTLEEVAEGADALVLLTDHDAYKDADLRSLASRMKPRAVFVDTRHFYPVTRVREAGLIYRGWAAKDRKE